MSVKTPKTLAPRNLAYLLAELVTPLRNQILPQSLHHVDTFRSFCQLPFGRCQDALEPDHDQITDDRGPDIVRSPAHEFLFELDDGVANRCFHGWTFRADYRVAREFRTRCREPFVSPFGLLWAFRAIRQRY